MAILVGIDEAGFGPILGPLVVSSSVFSIPSDFLQSDLWQILRRSIAVRRKQLAGRLLICDSKKAYSKSIGTKHLQRTVLACLKCLDKSPATLTEFLTILSPDCLSRLGAYPWYEQVDTHGFKVDSRDIEIASKVFADDLAVNSMKLLDLQSRCLDVGYYNRLVGDVKNKSSVLFTSTCQLVKQAWDKFEGSDLQVIIDRQGGRVRYRIPLQRMFGDMELEILKESPAISSYELKNGSRKMRLHFVVGGDDKFLPVSLASMVSKLLREFLIKNINSYFAGHYCELKPTAGYWKDGLRFIEDIKTNIPNLQYDSNQLIRCR